MYGRGEFLTAKRLNVEMKETADSDGSKQSMLRILKKLDLDLRGGMMEGNF
jgi:hypothetical protein